MRFNNIYFQTKDLNNNNNNNNNIAHRIKLQL